jgi:hypothetical protein
MSTEEPERGKMMKTKLAALAGTLALTLLMSITWGKGPDIGDPSPYAVGSGQQLVRGEAYTIPAVDNDGTSMSCEGTGLPSRTILDVFDALQPGSPDDTEIPPSGIPLDVSNQMSFFFPDPDEGPFEVIVKITVGPKNIFSFNVIGGGIHAINWKAGQYETLIDYGIIDTLPTPPGEEDIIEGMVFSDSNLNDRTGKSQEVSHLDFCLSAQTLPPFTSLMEGCIAPEICNPSGNQDAQFPNELQNRGFDNETVKQEPVPAIAGQVGECVGQSTSYVAHDIRLNLDGTPNPDERGPLDLSDLFDLTEFFPVTADNPTGALGKVILPEEVVGFPCLALLKGENSKEFSDFALVVDIDEPVIEITQYPSSVVDMYTLPGAGPLSDPNDTPPYSQRDMQFVGQASLQADDKTFHVEDVGGAFTSEVFNPSKLKSGRGTFYILNTREVCLDVTLKPDDGTPYFQAVQDCKTDIAVRHFFNLEQLINEANDRGNLISPSVNRLLNLHSKWLSMIKVGRYDESINRGTALRNAVVGGEWIINEFNDPGHMIMLIDNLLYRSQELADAEVLNAL